MENLNALNIMQLLKPGNDCNNFKIKTGYRDSTQKDCDFLAINGIGFKQADALSNMPLTTLSLVDTNLKSLDFLSNSVLGYSLKSLHLAQNNQLINYDPIKQLSVNSICIENSQNFNDTSIIHRSTRIMSITNTSIKQLIFSNPSNVTDLALFNNKLLRDYSSINELSNLYRLETNELVGTDLTKLIKLQCLTLKLSKVESFPILPPNDFTYICLFRCDKLLNIEALRGKKVKNLTLILSGNQLSDFSPILMTMEIKELNIIENDTKISIVEKLKKIKGLKKLRFNDNKQLL